MFVESHARGKSRNSLRSAIAAARGDTPVERAGPIDDPSPAGGGPVHGLRGNRWGMLRCLARTVDAGEGRGRDRRTGRGSARGGGSGRTRAVDGSILNRHRGRGACDVDLSFHLRKFDGRLLSIPYEPES